jgi:hypothetical protein
MQKNGTRPSTMDKIAEFHLSSIAQTLFLGSKGKTMMRTSKEGSDR